MSKKRRTFTDKFKAKVALDAVRSLKTLGELATEYKVHPNQISQWKRELLTHAPDLFSGKKSASFNPSFLLPPVTRCKSTEGLPEALQKRYIATSLRTGV